MIEPTSVSRCRSCNAPIKWGKTRAGKNCPYDLDSDGNPTDVSHFTTCPQASTWGKRDEAATPAPGEPTYEADPEAAPVTALVPAGALPLEHDLRALGKAMVLSGFFRDTQNAAQAVVKILAGKELGFGAIASMTGVYIVEGKVSISANLMAAAVKRSGKYNYRIREHTDGACSIEFYERGESVGLSEFTMADADRAGITRKAVWQQYARNMLFARAMSNGCRWYCADVFAGPTYTPEELGHDDLDEGEPC